MPQDWTIERLTAKHASSPCNPDIANAFFRAAFMESWGRGIDLIRNACRAAGNPAPAFRWDNGLWVEFALQEAITPVETLGKTPGKTLGKSSGKSSGESSGKTAAKIVELMRDTPEITIPEIAERLSKTTRAIEKQARQLKNDKVISRAGPDKGGHWEVFQ